ncbi:sigma-70 family RNA polymerase sigma factor [Conexibacter sp. JD483]|uniref:RNA polymerase sigma factor n=1 Tax=unclassified Conexibacter TaxID=2627773 RepID=UPI0027255870|nr:MULTISPECIES: sigma-70 family RNA polymerase sigma factor [unclassified Conexibacter]MDO8184500.1 sigma-70 family RNA polymerase sigma factor [Conexibacter sp. CPCC 205706]MDO8197806.1 sigma-70 family RNA polymerase sigma factor [Conexibacter sp. CPCC 205762]MDR9369212.1 sigma-70 family RNA polymerase sigma factor [Conexibacter sp. JD483]
MRAAATREARRYLLASHDVDDAVQEALMRAWRRRASCRGEDTLPWMRQIARNEALRLLDRRRTRSERELLDDETLLSTVSDDAAEEATENLLRKLQVGQVMGQLSVDDRRLLALRYAKDLSQPEVARMLGIPEGTVKVRLHRLRGRLRKELETSR